MSKCSICGKRIETTFLNKIIGTNIKDAKGKFHQVCKECQSVFSNDKEKMLGKIK